MELDFWIQIIQVVLLSTIVTQNFGLRDRLKELEAKLEARNGAAP